MKIKELYIENFGKLSKYKKSFTDGTNCIFEENGFGKTTLSVFIKAMLYGLDDTKKTSLDENERVDCYLWNRESKRIYRGREQRTTAIESKIAALAAETENVFFGKPCGLMDQLACAMGGIISVDFENTATPMV